jgi:hypothetical protein
MCCGHVVRERIELLLDLVYDGFLRSLQDTLCGPFLLRLWPTQLAFVAKSELDATGLSIGCVSFRQMLYCLLERV